MRIVARAMEARLGDVVIYRNTEGRDMPAIVTALIDGDSEAAHLHVFVPPGAKPDALSYQWGTAYSQEPRPGTWRPR